MLASITPERERADHAPARGAPVLDRAPTPARHHHWTGDLIASLVAVVVVGWLGWWATAAGFVDVASSDGIGRTAVVVIGLAVLLVWTPVAAMIYARDDHVYVRRAPARAWRLVAYGVLLGILVVGIPAFTAYVAGSL